MSRFIILVFVALIFARSEAKFPNNPKPCAHGDSECIMNMLTFLLKNKPDGYSSLNLVKFEPLKISSIDIKQGKESPVNIDLRFRDSELSGISQAEVTALKGFGADLTQHNEIRFRIPVISLVGDYKISGKVLILPVQGTGRSNITLVDSDLRIQFFGTPDVKPDGTYMKVKNMRLSVDPKRVYFNFENLFNGDKALGDNMNLFVNENWEDIFHEVQVSIGGAFSQVFESVINNVFQKYPYEKFFTKEQ